jgi:apolipoprotein D and lipocalin family protein
MLERSPPSRTSLAAALLLAALALGCGTTGPELRTVDAVDLERYQGRWYEIASFPQRFQEGCVATRATYTLEPEGEVRVLNECREETLDGEWRRIEGRAWVEDPADSSAKLLVQFFWPFRGAYWVIELDPDYRTAVVGHPSRDYLWILSRTPQMDPAVYDALLQRIEGHGFDLTRLRRTPQPTTAGAAVDGSAGRSHALREIPRQHRARLDGEGGLAGGPLQQPAGEDRLRIVQVAGDQLAQHRLAPVVVDAHGALTPDSPIGSDVLGDLEGAARVSLEVRDHPGRALGGAPQPAVPGQEPEGGQHGRAAGPIAGQAHRDAAGFEERLDLALVPRPLPFHLRLPGRRGGADRLVAPTHAPREKA